MRQASHQGGTTTMEHQERERWVFISDIRGGRLLKCRIDLSRDRCRLEETARIENALYPHDRGGKTPSAGPRGVSYADPDRDHDDMRDRFAGEVGRWLNRQIEQRRIDTLEVFAPPEFLGALRQSLPRSLRANIRDHATQLTWMKTGDLQNHPAIRELISS